MFYFMAGQLFKLMQVYVNATLLLYMFFFVKTYPKYMSLVLEGVVLFAWGNF